MELIDKNVAIGDICTIASKVASEAPYDKEWFDRMIDRQREIIEIIESVPVYPSISTCRWIPIKFREPTEEEKESIPEAEYWFDCELPEHGEEVLITTAYNNSIAMTTFANYGDDGCVFEDWDAEDVRAWCKLPEPYTT